MKTNEKLPAISSIIRDAGLVVVNTPSVNYPIAVSLFYRNNPDGSLCGLWPKGNRLQNFSEFFAGGSLKDKFIATFCKLFLNVGMDSVLAHGSLVLYTDVPTATYLQKQWRKD